MNLVLELSCEFGSGLLLARNVGGATYMQVTQVMQRGPLLVAHPASEVGIVESLVARRFRHVLQHAELLLHHLLAVPRHLPPTRQDIILDVIALVGR